MKTRLLWILLAVVANIALVPMALVTPKNAVAVSSSRFFFNCCKETAAGDPYCCGSCCVFTFDCLSDRHCGDE